MPAHDRCQEERSPPPVETGAPRAAERLRNARLAVTQLLARAAAVGEAARGVLETVCEALDWDVGALWLADRPANVLRCQEVWHRPGVRFGAFEPSALQTTFSPGVGLPGRVWASGQPVWAADIARDANFPRAALAAADGIHAAFACPIAAGGEVLGVLEFFSRAARPPDADQLEMMATLGERIWQFLERRRAEEAWIDEQTRLAAFVRDVGLALNRSDALPDMLRHCCEALVRHLHGACARVWTLNGGEDVLELQASAGLDTHVEGPHRRVPVGQYKIGLIARERTPHLTNAVAGDPCVHDQEWAREHGLVSFAGYPLLVEERIVGVMAMFARQPLSGATVEAMASVANGIALGIERKQAEAQLRQQREQFQRLADSMPQLAWMTRPDGYIVWYNRRWYEYTGATPEQMEGWGWQSVHDPAELPRVLARFQAALAGGEPWEDTFPLRRHDGEMRWHLSRALPVRDEQGRVVRWFGTNTDITERLQLEDELRRSRDQLEERVRERTAELAAANAALHQEIRERCEAEEKVQAFAAELQRSNRELEQFASVASHDLQEPLRKIQAFGDRLQTKCADGLGEQGRDYLGRMRAAAARMSTLINDLLAFSRVTTRGQPFVPVDLTREARQVVSDLEGRLQHTGGRVEVGELPDLHADPLQLRQLLQNLIANGLKFHRPDVPPVVRVEGRRVSGPGGEELCEIAVRDNGIGFDEKYVDRIFQLFQRLHSRSEYEGTGLGLAICRKIVERHGGTITARSAPGQGATFLVTLPLRPAPEERTP